MEGIAGALTDRQSRVHRLLVAGACLVVIVAGLKAAAPIVSTVLLGLLIAQTLSPLPVWLMKKGLKPGASVLLSILVVVAGGLVLVTLLGFSTARLMERLPTYQSGLTALREQLNAFLSSWGIDLSQFPALQALSPTRVVAAARATLVGLASAFGTSILILLIAAVGLYELARHHASKSGGRKAGTLAARFDEVSAESRQYVALTGLAGLLQAGVNLVILLIAGADAPLMWAVLFFFLNFVPGVGFLVALVPPALLVLLEHGWERALIVVTGYWIVNLLGDNVIKPRFLVKGLDLSFTLLVFAVVFWTWVLGAVGTILAVPLALTIKQLAAEQEGGGG